MTAIHIASNLLSADVLHSHCQQLGSQHVIISDENVAPLYAKYLLALPDANLITVPAGETSKSREMKVYIEEQLFKLNANRDTVIIALGGGVITDLAGFVAATFYRGLSIVYCPTTLLGMVDASIGGKTGINTRQGKNLLGCIREPNAIFMDTATLTTLPDIEWLNGLAETIKHALIADAAFFKQLQDHVAQFNARDPEWILQLVKTSSSIKQKIVAGDLYDTSRRQQLNLGHTLAHAIEVASDYRISHGIAVALGILGECQVHYPQFLPPIQRLFKSYEFPLQLPNLDSSRLYQALKQDKKSRQHGPQVATLEAIGQATKELQPLNTTQLDFFCPAGV